jgi:hypothetical protein
MRDRFCLSRVVKASVELHGPGRNYSSMTRVSAFNADSISP